MAGLRDRVHEFLLTKESIRVEAAQTAALSLICGLDLATVLGAEGDDRALALKTIERSLHRERLKGLAGHWSYDLNRHIALKQVLDRLLRRDTGCRTPCDKTAKKGNGARRRRTRRRKL